MKKITYSALKEFLYANQISYRFTKPDWDAISLEFKLPNGLECSATTVCDNELVDDITVYAVDEYVEVDTIDELLDLMTVEYDSLIRSLAKDDPEFPIEDYLIEE